MNGVIAIKKNKILKFISEKQLKQAFEEITKLSVRTQDWLISEKIVELEMTYRYMLRYQFENSIDPEQKNVYNNIIRSLYEITDDIVDDIMSTTSNDLIYDRIRINSLRDAIKITDYKNQIVDLVEENNLVDILENGTEKKNRTRSLAIKRERIGSDLFNMGFISQRATPEDMIDFISFIEDIQVPSREKCLFVSALTLNLMHRFDARKLQVLMNGCKSDIQAIKFRSIIGIVVLLQLYDKRWHLYPECVQQMESLMEDGSFRKHVLSVIKQLIRSRETEKISKKLTEEIIPEMMKFSSLAKRKLNIEDILNDSDFSEKNPEWKQELEKSGLADKLQEYSELQIEGADVFHSAFANLKNFPFFSDISNWFLPFDPAYSELQSLNTDNNSQDNLLYTAILNSGHMCNSDKYSFCFSLLQIPSGQREMMMQQFGVESDEIKRLQKEAMETNPGINNEIISNQYIQDLYRFFKLYRRKNEFFDIFTLNINFYEIKSIVPLISDTESMFQIASYCFEKNFLPEALYIYRILCMHTESSDIWQKIGYCEQMLNNMQGALQAYLQADLFLPNNTWTLKHIAHTYKALKEFDKAIEYYKKAEKLKPDDLFIAINIGHCYLGLKDYDNALNSYFKVEMLSEKNASKAWRPIAWTAFLMQRYELSEQYYEFIKKNNPNIHDFLNMGHVKLAQKNYKDAIAYYIEAVTLDKENIVNILSLIEEDKEILLSVGIEESIFPLLYDQLKYNYS